MDADRINIAKDSFITNNRIWELLQQFFFHKFTSLSIGIIVSNMFMYSLLLLLFCNKFVFLTFFRRGILFA
uniref:7TM_GPCR_Srx domain-containing protein n=1 Tax=Globodera pallida TaxID=36090 RepID=A0A183C0J4_GLOPA